jgi:hypothetical protein
LSSSQVSSKAKPEKFRRTANEQGDFNSYFNRRAPLDRSA